MRNQRVNSWRRYFQRRIGLEQLEGRAMLAGNVTAAVIGGNLIVRGDNQDNLVLVQQTSPGTYTVTGLDFADAVGDGFQAGPTSVNGLPNGTVVLDGVSGDVNIDLKRGNDGLGIGNSTDDLESLATYCGISLGSGGDGAGGEEMSAVAPVEGRFYVPRNLIVNTGDGNDLAVMIADVNGAAIINTGSGDDHVAFGNAPELESKVNIASDLIILTGNGNDDACIRSVTLQGLLNIQTGYGNDDVGALAFEAGHVLTLTGNGNDRVFLSQFDVDREVLVDSGNDNDDVVLANFSAGRGFGPQGQLGAGFVTVVTGAGNDEAHLHTFVADGVVLNTGAGNDGSLSMESPVSVEAATITNGLTILTGAGNDIIAIQIVTARNVFIDTGAGNDVASLIDLIVHNDLNAYLGSGGDRLGIGAGPSPVEVGHNVLIDAGAGNDQVAANVAVLDSLFLYLGAGNDTAALDHTTVNNLTFIDAGAGNDTVTIVNGILDQLMAFMGIGDDHLILAGSTGNKALLRGGPRGFDSLTLQSNTIETLDRSEFEIIFTIP